MSAKSTAPHAIDEIDTTNITTLEQARAWHADVMEALARLDAKADGGKLPDDLVELYSEFIIARDKAASLITELELPTFVSAEPTAVVVDSEEDADDIAKAEDLRAASLAASTKAK